MGGYVWRIAKHSVDATCAVGVLSVEAQKVIHTGHEGAVWVDDELTETDIALIVSTYNMDTDYPGQTATVSWFPPPHAYESGHTRDGFVHWTDYREQGYQLRLRQYAEGKKGPMNVGSWRKSLHGDKKVQRWKGTLERDSKEWIDNYKRKA